VVCDLLQPLAHFWSKALSYLKPVAEAAKTAGPAAAPGPVYPGITQSIREAKNVADWGVFFAGMSLSSWVGAASGLGVLALMALRPAFTLLLPLLGLGAASLFMGVRFAMFGGTAFALGLGIGAHWLAKALLHRTGAGARALPGVQVAVAAIGLFTYAHLYTAYKPTPVLAPAHALALMKLKDIAPKDASVWTWWDFGYAAQYYAERRTPTDGGKHAGRDIFPTALALTTPSFRQAAQLILLSAGLDNEPARRWDKMPAKDVSLEIQALAQADVPLKRPAPQYLVVCWENVTLLHWLTFYGSWDLAAGKGVHAKTQSVDQAFNVDAGRGIMVMRGPGAPIPVSKIGRASCRERVS
jgi:dolichyl-diphosphooligosaccharide--protein glycosyltransferase